MSLFIIAISNSSDSRSSPRPSSGQNGLASRSHRPSSGIDQQNPRTNRTSSTSNTRPPMPLPPDRATTMQHTSRPPMPLPLPHPTMAGNQRRQDSIGICTTTTPSSRTNFGRSPEPTSSSPPLPYVPPPVPSRRPNRFVSFSR